MPVQACSWLNESYALPQGAYVDGHGTSTEAVNPVTFDNGYVGVDVVDDHAAHVWITLCVDRVGGDSSTCSASDGDTVLTGYDRIEATFSGAHGAAHVFLASLFVSPDGTLDGATTGRVYWYFSTDCAANPPRVGPGLGVPSL